MKTLVFLLAAMLLVPSVTLARAPRKESVATPPLVEGIPACDTDGYYCYHWDEHAYIPDNDPTGVLIGPLPTYPGAEIFDVILRVNIEHTYIGDLIVELLYDADCDGTPETFGGVLCRHGLAGCPTDDCCGCAGDLFGWYGFDDTVASIEDDCFAPFPPGCYGPDYDSAGLDVFDGLALGGCFWLRVIDGAAYDEGAVAEWEVWVRTQPLTEGFALDIKPTSCPNPFNINSMGVLPVAILGSESLDTDSGSVMDIDPSTIVFAGAVEPLRYDYEDVATPVGPDAEPCECNELGPDGAMDMTLKFDRQAVVSALGPVNDGDVVVVGLTASLWDGTAIMLTDCMWIIDNSREGLKTAIQAPSGVGTWKSANEATSWSCIKALYR
jgi:hypothetical protein